MDAIKCVVEVSPPFMCHMDKSGKTMCAGYAAMLTAESKPGKAPWPFSHEVLCKCDVNEAAR